MTATPSTWAEDSTVIESNPTRIVHRGRVHTYVQGHTRGGVPIKAHWRPAPQPQGFAEPTDAEPAEIFKGKRS